MIDQKISKTINNLQAAASVGIDVLLSDRSRATDVEAVLVKAGRDSVLRTLTHLIGVQLEKHPESPLVACAAAGRAIVDDIYSRLPLKNSPVSEPVKEGLGRLVGGALFAVLRSSPGTVPSLDTSVKP